MGQGGVVLPGKKRIGVGKLIGKIPKKLAGGIIFFLKAVGGTSDRGKGHPGLSRGQITGPKVGIFGRYPILVPRGVGKEPGHNLF